MPKLIVEEGGKKRAFRLGKGILTVGSGAEARLKLAASEVAAVHFELDVSDEGIKLRPRPGVVPPRIVGQPIQGEVELALGKKVELAGATLWLEEEEAPGAAPAPAAVPAPRSVVAPARAGRPSRSREAREPREREVKSGGAPGWLVPMLVVLGVAVVALFLFKNVLKGADADEGRAFNLIQAARQERGASRFDSALAKLDQIPEAAFTPELKAEADALRLEIQTAIATDALELENRSGDKYFDVLLKRYEANYLQGTPERAKVRLFLKRCVTFRKRWPRHGELEWVGRQEERFKGYVDMAAPPDWPDVEWEVRDLVDGKPRNYEAALALLDELLSRVEGQDRAKAQNRRDALVAERVEYAQDRLFEARHQFEKKQDTTKAIWWLMNSVALLGEQSMEDDAARFLVKMPDLPGHLLGYRQDYPDLYADVLQNSIVADWAERAEFKP